MNTSPMYLSITGEVLCQEPSSWLTDSETFQNVEDFHIGEDSIIESSDLETSLKEISNIPEVQVDESEDDEDIKMSVLQEFFPDLGLPEDTFETNKELIADVENFLTSVSGESTKIEDSWQLSDLTAPTTAAPIKSEYALSSEAALSADSIFESLIKGEVFEEMQTDDVKEIPSSFTAVRADGEKVIIVIAPPTKTLSAVDLPQPEIKTDRIMLAPPSPAVSSISAMSPGMLSSSAAESDAEWQPSDGEVKRPRKKYERKVPTRRPKAEPYPRNKVERKKAQNRTAAWKYREKKKAEQDEVNQELNLLLDKNVDLKKRLSDMELQAKCLKQLMAEAGMGYLINSL
jgi:hypothetical protein